MDDGPGRDALHSLMDLGELLKSTSLPGIVEWNRLVSRTPRPRVNGNHIWVKPK